MSELSEGKEVRFMVTKVIFARVKEIAAGEDRTVGAWMRKVVKDAVFEYEDRLRADVMKHFAVSSSEVDSGPDTNS